MVRHTATINNIGPTLEDRSSILISSSNIVHPLAMCGGCVVVVTAWEFVAASMPHIINESIAVRYITEVMRGYITKVMKNRGSAPQVAEGTEVGKSKREGPRRYPRA